MRPHLVSVVSCAVLALLVPVSRGEAQPLGTFSWQLAPFCNVVTFTVTHNAGTYTLDGFDAACGAVRRAPATGIAVPNPDGTIGLGLTIINAPGGVPVHVNAVVSLPSVNGTWSDTSGNRGDFVLNGAGGGIPLTQGAFATTRFNTAPTLFGLRANGTPDAPTPVGNNTQLLLVGARGHDGTAFATADEAQIRFMASETWDATSHGTKIDFLTTENGTTATNARMTIHNSGNVGIGIGSPVRPLDVDGNIRIGTGAFGCVEDRDGDVVAGICASDARFKRDITSFAPMLDKVASLRPVHFYWRTAEFPARAFGSRESYGLVAQEVEQVLPELVATDADGYKAVNYSQLPLVALQAIKELKAENDALRTELEQRLAALAAQIAHLTTRAQNR